jgi:uncharacterized protein
MESPLELKMLGTGSNWMNVGSIIAVALNSYYSPLPPGSVVSVSTMDPGYGAMESPNLVAAGKYHTGMTTPGWYGRLAYEGKAPFAEPLPIRGLALFPHDDRMVFAVRAETGITSLREIRDRKIPLRYSIPTVIKSHPATWATDEVFAAYGFSRADLDAWGGTQLRDRPKTQSDPAAKPVSDDWEALFDEAIMTPRWRNLTTMYDVRFLPVDEDVLAALEARGMVRGVIERGRFRGVERDVPTLDFSDWLMFCRDDLDDAIAYHLVKTIDDNAAAFNKRIPVALTAPVEIAKTVQNMPIPLHPGAQRYYAEKGYISGARV